MRRSWDLKGWSVVFVTQVIRSSVVRVCPCPEMCPESLRRGARPRVCARARVCLCCKCWTVSDALLSEEKGFGRGTRLGPVPFGPERLAGWKARSGCRPLQWMLHCRASICHSGIMKRSAYLCQHRRPDWAGAARGVLERWPEWFDLELKACGGARFLLAK